MTKSHSVKKSINFNNLCHHVCIACSGTNSIYSNTLFANSTASTFTIASIAVFVIEYIPSS